MLLKYELDAGETVIAEVGKFPFACGAVEWDVTLPWRGFAGNVAAGFTRKVSGGAVVLVTHLARSGSASSQPGSPI